MLTGTQRDRILSALAEWGQGIKASELADHLLVLPYGGQAAQRDVVGRLQALKGRWMVTYERQSESRSAAGRWTVSGRGRRAVSRMAPPSVESCTLP